MSDFLYSALRQPPERLRAILADFLDPVTAEYSEFHGDWGSIAVACCSHDHYVVADDEDFLTVLLGEPIISVDEDVSGIGGKVRRQALHELLQGPPDISWDDHLDGPFAALAIDKQGARGMCLTDLVAAIPLFSAQWDSSTGRGLVIGSHVDAVARAAECSGRVDPVSALDMVIHGGITYPHTLYPGVSQVTPAAAREFTSAGEWVGRAVPYWRPYERDVYRSLGAAARELREAVEDDLRVTCADEKTVGLLLSAGEDSRAVLGAIPEGTHVEGFIYADWENREVRVARSVANAYGAELTVGIRHPEHYLRGMETAAKLVGSQNRFIDVHGYGFHKDLALDEFPVMLGGYSADTLLKGQYSRTKLPKSQEAFGTDEAPRIPRLPGVRAEHLQEVASRRERWRQRLLQYRPTTADEWVNLWPFSMRRASANFHGNRRLFRSHEPFMCNRVVKLGTVVPASWKKRRRLFLAAFRRNLAPAWHVPHARSLYPYFGFYPNLLLGAGVRFGRHLRARASSTVGVHQGPWPDRAVEVRSGQMTEKRWSYPIAGTALEQLFSGTASEYEAAIRAGWTANQQLLLLELVYLIRADAATDA